MAILYAGQNLVNLLINPQFEINQEVITLGSHGAGVYFRDQWKAGSSGATLSLNEDILTISAGSVIQPIEDVNIPTGTYTISWEGTSQVKIDGGSAQDSPYTFSISSGTHVEVEFTTGTLQQPVLVNGSSNRKFTRPDFTLEIVRCQRYFSKTYAFNIAPGVITPNGRIIEFATRNESSVVPGCRFVVTMRTTPTVIAYSPASGTSGQVYSAGDKAVSSIADLNENGFANVDITGSGATSSQNASYHYTADARI